MEEKETLKRESLIVRIRTIAILILFAIAFYGILCVPSILVGYGFRVGFMLNPFIAPFIGVCFWYFILETFTYFKIILKKIRNKK